MSDLSVFESLPSGVPQLPPGSYFDSTTFSLEQQRLFSTHPRYVGHVLSVPDEGDFYTLAHERNGRTLVHTSNGVELVSNVCRHRQAIMLGSLDTSIHHRGNLSQTGGNIVCPLHRWTYSASGELLGAPHFATDPCLHLDRYTTQQWNGLIFENPTQASDPHVATTLARLGCASELDFAGYQFHSARVHHCDYNWKTFIEIYLEDYHVDPFHPGLGHFVRCADLRWELRESYSVQTVGMRYPLGKAGSEVYARWHAAVGRVCGQTPPKYGAIWLTLYPNVMLEWYPHVLVVSAVHALSAQKTVNVVEFFYPEEICAFEPEFIEAQQAAYMQTCEEDDEIALRMEAGRHALMQRGQVQTGPYQSPMEDGMQHFHEWYRRRMHAAGPRAAVPTEHSSCLP